MHAAAHIWRQQVLVRAEQRCDKCNKHDGVVAPCHADGVLVRAACGLGQQHCISRARNWGWDRVKTRQAAKGTNGVRGERKIHVVRAAALCVE